MIRDVACDSVAYWHVADIDGHWVAAECVLIRLTPDNPPRIAFTIAPAPPERALAHSQRVTDLESRLQRIAAELRSAGLLDAIDRVPVPSEHPRLNQLTSRQWEILVHLLRGQRVQTIAAELFLSPGTVRNHLSAIFSLFDVHSQAELLALLQPR